jgi:hypothetical protein
VFVDVPPPPLVRLHVQKTTLISKDCGSSINRHGL